MCFVVHLKGGVLSSWKDSAAADVCRILSRNAATLGQV